MSVRQSIKGDESHRIPTGYDGSNVQTDVGIPKCTIEDLDRAIYNLFDKSIPLFFEKNKQMSRVPVVFAGGERFAFVGRRFPVRDRTNSFVLPMIAIHRETIDQRPERGVSSNQSLPIVVKTRVSQDDHVHKMFSNDLGLVNQSNASSDVNRIGADSSRTVTIGSKPTGIMPGTLVRRRSDVRVTANARSGRLLADVPRRSVYEITSIPPPKFVNVKYSVTLWSQYIVQMNNMIEAITSSYTDMNTLSFRVESDSGYWFVVYMNSLINTGDNFDDMTDQERMIKMSFDMDATGYIVLPEYPGAPSGARKFVSSPSVAFDVSSLAGKLTSAVTSAGPESGNALDRSLDDVMTTSVSVSRRVGESKLGDALGVAAGMNRDADLAANHTQEDASIGGFSAGSKSTGVVVSQIDPLTGQQSETVMTVRTLIQRKGETVYTGHTQTRLGTIASDE